MKKLFVVSDVHGFFDEMKSALDEAGFDPSNESHWLISCGDNFDRGVKPDKVMEYMMGLERKVLVRGNHEDLFDEMCKRHFAEYFDYHNGTQATVNLLTHIDHLTHHAFDTAYKMTRPFFSQMLDYFETQHYIFVHGWYPVREQDWRKAHTVDWESARWYNGMKQAAAGHTVPGKTIVCGHWHCSYGHHMEDPSKPEYGDDADFSPYYSDGIIAIDGCTAHSHRVNVLVLEDEFLQE